MELSADPLAAGVGLLNTGYNIYTNKRDFDYQKALQQQMFEREDTAIQRRMADLQAAGLNPSLAGGQGAGAGAVVSRSNTNDVNMGSALDTIQALNTIRQQRLQTEQTKIQNDILNKDKNIKDQQETLATANLLNQLSVPFKFRFTVNNGQFNVKPVLGDWANENGKYYQNDEDTALTKLFNFNQENQKNTAYMLQKEADFYDADKVAGYLLPLLKLLK